VGAPAGPETQNEKADPTDERPDLGPPVFYPRSAYGAKEADELLETPLHLSPSEKEVKLIQPGLYIMLGGAASGKTIFLPPLAKHFESQKVGVRRYIIGEPVPGRTPGGAQGLSFIIDDFLRSASQVLMIDSLKPLLNTGGNATAGGIPREFFSIIDGIDSAFAAMGKLIIASVNPLVATPEEANLRPTNARVDAFTNVKAALLGASRGVITLGGYPSFDGRAASFTLNGVEASIRPGQRSSTPLRNMTFKMIKIDPDRITGMPFNL